MLVPTFKKYDSCAVHCRSTLDLVARAIVMDNCCLCEVERGYQFPLAAVTLSACYGSRQDISAYWSTEKDFSYLGLG